MLTLEKKKFLAILALCLLFGVFLWAYTDPPPHGRPDREGNFYDWQLVDISYKLKHFQMDFWDPTVLGGSSLFSSGLYPIVSPFNLLLLIFSPSQFANLMQILPYVMGVFFTAALLLHKFKVRLPYALFGGFVYVGGMLSRYSLVLEFPLQLWAVGLFPAMVYAYFFYQNAYLAAGIVGSLIGLQFATGGAPLLLQTLVWWLFFIMAKFLLTLKKGFRWANLRNSLLSGLLLMTMAVGLFGIQFIPTYQFSISESARYPGRYSIGSFPLDALFHTFTRGIISEPMGASARGVWALFFLSTGLLLSMTREGLSRMKGKDLFGHIGLACLLYLCVPNIIEFLALKVPFLGQMFSVFTKFTLGYGIYTLDFCLAIYISIVLNAYEESIRPAKQTIIKFLLGYVLIGFALIVISLPLLLAFAPSKKLFLTFFPLLQGFTLPQNVASALVVFLTTALIISKFTLQLRQRWIGLGLFVALPFLGFMTSMTSYNFNEKAKQTHAEDYDFSSPEHAFYSTARGKYYFAYHVPSYMFEEYHLVFGIHSGPAHKHYAALAPARIVNFMYHYHQDNSDNTDEIYLMYPRKKLIEPSEGLASHFPIEFCTVEHGEILPWKDFKKEVSGNQYDIWVRKGDVPKVRFAQNLKILKFKEVISQFDVPFSDTVYVAEEDASAYGLEEATLESTIGQLPTYINYVQERGDYIKFEVDTPTETFVIIPQNYQKGWQLFVGGKTRKLFPADYLFIGFRLPAGQHTVELRFRPPGLFFGLIASVVSIGVAMSTLTWFILNKNRKVKTEPLDALVAKG